MKSVTTSARRTLEEDELSTVRNPSSKMRLTGKSMIRRDMHLAKYGFARRCLGVQQRSEAVAQLAILLDCGWRTKQRMEEYEEGRERLGPVWMRSMPRKYGGNPGAALRQNTGASSNLVQPAAEVRTAAGLGDSPVW